jgi:hypothetical protein
MRRAFTLAILFALQAPCAYGAGLDDHIRELAGLAKAGANVRTESYDVNSFSISARTEQMRPRISAVDKQCDILPVIGRDVVIPLVGLFDAFIDNANKVEALVKRLNKEKTFLAAVGYFLEGMNGPEEKCSEEYLSMYFSNGTTLIIEFDY